MVVVALVKPIQSKSNSTLISSVSGNYSRLFSFLSLHLSNLVNSSRWKSLLDFKLIDLNYTMSCPEEPLCRVYMWQTALFLLIFATNYLRQCLLAGLILTNP